MSFRCATCAELHEGIPDVGFAKPDPWFGIAEAERDRRTHWDANTCTIDDAEFFVRGVLYLPVMGEQGRFGLGVWVSQSRASYDRYVAETADAPAGSSFGWLSTNIPGYAAPTFGLQTTVRFNGVTRPAIELHVEQQHVLVHEQREGITLARAWEIVHHCTR